MTGRRARLWKLASLLALGCAGAVGASAPDLSTEPWVADPESQFLLDVSIRRTRLAEPVRAYPTPEGACILFGDFVKTLDVPVEVDLAAKRASGWAFREANRISVNLAAMTASYGGKGEAIPQGAIRETSEGWCVDGAALSRWFGITVKAKTGDSLLQLESEQRLPVELAMERLARAQRIKPAAFDIAKLPQVRLPYRMWRAPALDFVVSAGATFRAHDGVKVDRRTSVLAAGEIAHLSYDARFATNERARPSSLRLRAYRSDPDGGLLGPLKATHFEVGDVVGFESPLTSSGGTGRGVVVTNRPLWSQSAFDRTRFEGELPPGWEAEIYRNGELLGFARPDGSQRYAFEDVQLLYGENRISIHLYGPQGQVRTRDELINVGQDNVPPGKTWYWAGASQPGRDLAALEARNPNGAVPKAQAAVSVEHGLDRRTSVGMLARTMLVEDEQLTFVEGSVRRSVGRALIEVGAARDSNGGQAGRAQLLAKLGSVNLSAEAVTANDFRLRGRRGTRRHEGRISLDAPLRLGRTRLSSHADLRVTDNRDGSRSLEAAARLSGTIDRFNLATELRHRRHYLRSGPAPPGELNLDIIGAGRVGDVRLRGSTSFKVAPDAHFRSAELAAYWSASDRVDWEGGLAYDARGRRARARVGHVRRFDNLAVSVTGEAASDGSLAAGVNLNFSLDPNSGLKLSRQPLASAGAVHARVFRDLNDNGTRDFSEPFEPGALVTTGRHLSEKPTDSRGSVLLAGLQTYQPITVGVDESSLADPMLVPKKTMQVVVPRPGVAATVEIPLVGGGDIEGAVVKSAEVPIEGLDLELVDGSGKLIATARSDFDGFFLFQRVPYGRYSVRVAKDSAIAAGVEQALEATAEVSAEKPVARLGTVQARAPPRIASLE